MTRGVEHLSDLDGGDADAGICAENEYGFGRGGWRRVQ